METYSGRDPPEDLSKKKKSVKIGPISQMFTTQNIQMYRNSDLFKTAVNS